MNPDAHSFDRLILSELESLFPRGRVQIFLPPPVFPFDPLKMDPSIKLVDEVVEGRGKTSIYVYRS